MGTRVARLREQLADGRSGRMVFLSHCLLNENVRYLGGAGGRAGARARVEGYLTDGVGICQLPCPEQRVWGGVLKRRMLLAYGARGTWRSPLVRLGLGPFLWATRAAYRRLARGVAAEVADYHRSGFEVVGVVGVAGSPSCGVRTTLDVPAATNVLRRCPMARLDVRTVRDRAVDAHVRPGTGMFVEALRSDLERRGVPAPFLEHDFAADC